MVTKDEVKLAEHGMTPFHNAVTFHSSTSEVLTKISRFQDFFPTWIQRWGILSYYPGATILQNANDPKTTENIQS